MAFRNQGLATCGHGLATCKILSLLPTSHFGDALGNFRIVVFSVEDFAACTYGEEGYVAVAMSTADPSDEGGFVDDVAGGRCQRVERGIERFLALVRIFLQGVEGCLQALLLIVVQRNMFPEAPVFFEVCLHHFPREGIALLSGEFGEMG